MPAMLDDPTSPPIKTSYPTAFFAPKHVKLRDGSTATFLAFTSPSQAPPALIQLLSKTLAEEIEAGDTYPITEPLSPTAFGAYWFGLFAVVAFSGTFAGIEELNRVKEEEWEDLVLGSFYVKPNYPGRSSHVCNAGFLVTIKSRSRGVGKEMGKAYLDWAPKLGYTYSVFNLVYETNVASCRIWDSLGFERIGRVKKCGILKSFPGRKVDAIVYGYDFEPDRSN